jgi:hypothetical protein
MKHRKVIGLIALVMLLACVTAIPVLAQQPCQFKGTVTLDGASVAAGTPITAELTDGTQVGSTTAYIDGGVSKYNMIVPQVDDVPAEGAALNFYVNGYLGGTSTWNTGANKALNLAAGAGDGPYTLTVTISPSGKGTVTKNPNLTQYPANTVVTLTASAISGWDFDYWGGAASGTNPTVQVTMNADKSVTAYFEQEGAAVAGTFASWLYETFVECLID